MRKIVMMLAVAFYCVTGFAQERRVSILADHIYDVAKQQKVSYREAAQKIYDMGYRGADVRVDCDLLMLADLDAIGFRNIWIREM